MFPPMGFQLCIGVKRKDITFWKKYSSRGGFLKLMNVEELDT